MFRVKAKTPMIRMKNAVRFPSQSRGKPLDGLWKDPQEHENIPRKITDNWMGAALVLVPLLGFYAYFRYEHEKERREYLSSPHLAVLPHNYKGIQGKSCDESFF